MPEESFSAPSVQEHEPVKVSEPEAETTVLPAPDINPHGHVTGVVTTDLATGKIIKASYPQDGSATHK